MSQITTQVTASSMGAVVTLTGDSGGAVSPDGAGNINILATGPLNVAGNPGTNTLTVDWDAATDGQLVIAATAGTPAFASLTSTGGTIAFTPGANSLNLEATISGALTWTEVTVAGPTGMAVNNGYIANNAVSTVQLTLPAVAVVGDVVRVSGKGAGGWQIQQNAGQTIFIGTQSTTPGAGGTLSSTQTRDAVELLCVTANNDWNVLSSLGNLTVV